MITTSNNIHVFSALLRRNMKVFGSNLFDSVLDGLIIVLLDVLLFGYLFPLMGMSDDMIAPLFIGNIIFVLFMVNFSFSFQVLFDLKFSRLIDYHITLPISKFWLFAAYIINFAIQAIAITAPSGIIGYLLLSSRFTAINPNIPLLIVSYLLCIVFFALFFVALSFNFSFDWFRMNVWPRILSPLLCLSTDLFPWHKLYAFWPLVANLFLLNPITYVVESLRSSFVGSPESLPITYCLVALSASIVGATWFLAFGVQKRLDPV